MSARRERGQKGAAGQTLAQSGVQTAAEPDPKGAPPKAAPMRTRGASAAPGLFAGIRIVAGREFSASLESGVAYVYTIAFALLANSIFMNEFFLAGQVEMGPWFETMPLLLAVFLPAVTMRLWAEEKRQRTIELLLTLPLRPIQAILGKLLAALGLFGLFALSSAPIVVMLYALGEPDGGRIAAGYLGLSLLGLLFLSFGLFLSAISGDQITAFVLTALLAFLVVLVGDERVVAILDGLGGPLALGSLFYENLSVVPHYESFARGVIALPSVLFFLGTSAAFLWLNALLIERTRG